MKPSEAGTWTSPGPTYVRLATNWAGQYTWRTTAKMTEKSRSPMTYAKPTYWSPYPIGHKWHSTLKYKWPKPYKAEVYSSYCGIAVKQRLDTKTKLTTTLEVHNPHPKQKFSIPLFVSSALHNAEVQANVDFLNKVHERKYMLLEEMRNRKDTAKSLVQSARKLVRMYKKVRKNPVRALRSVPKEFRSARKLDTVGDAWMEYRYFWMPIYLTIETALKDTVKPVHFTEAYHKSDISSHSWGADLSHTNQSTFEKTPRGEFTMQTQFKRGCYVVAETSDLRKFGISSVSEIAAVGWELIPFSFVVDWIFPVADYLTAVGAKKGLVTYCDWQTRKDKISFSPYSWNVYTRPPYNEHPFTRTTYTDLQRPTVVEWEKYERTTRRTISLNTTPFVASQPLNWRRTLDSLAIFGTGKEPLAKKAIKRLSPR